MAHSRRDFLKNVSIGMAAVVTGPAILTNAITSVHQAPFKVIDLAFKQTVFGDFKWLDFGDRLSCDGMEFFVSDRDFKNGSMTVDWVRSCDQHHEALKTGIIPKFDPNKFMFMGSPGGERFRIGQPLTLNDFPNGQQTA